MKHDRFFVAAAAAAGLVLITPHVAHSGNVLALQNHYEGELRGIANPTYDSPMGLSFDITTRKTNGISRGLSPDWAPSRATSVRRVR